MQQTKRPSHSAGLAGGRKANPEKQRRKLRQIIVACNTLHTLYLQTLDLYMSYKHPVLGAEVLGVEARNLDWLDQLKQTK